MPDNIQLTGKRPLPVKVVALLSLAVLTAGCSEEKLPKVPFEVNPTEYLLPEPVSSLPIDIADPQKRVLAFGREKILTNGHEGYWFCPLGTESVSATSVTCKFDGRWMVKDLGKPTVTMSEFLL